MFSPRSPGRTVKPSLRQLVVQLGVDEVDLAQVRLARVTGHPRAVLHQLAQVRVAAHAEAGDQLDARPGRLAELVPPIAAHGRDLAVHLAVRPASAARPACAHRAQTRVLAVPLEITAARPDPALLDLPWEMPLEEWPADQLAALPRGISRHVVRFVRMSGRVIAIKEIKDELARREYGAAAPARPAGPARGRAARRRRRPGGPRRAAAGERAGHPAPAVLAALPRAVQPDPAAGHRAAAGRRAGRAAGPAAPGRLLLGRRLAVEHAVPARRRGLRGVPRGRRDRRPARLAERRASASTTSTWPGPTSPAS